MKNLHKHRAVDESFRSAREQPRYLKNKRVEVSKPLGPKYELVEVKRQYRGEKLYQIRALRDFDTIIAGTLGGFVASEDNLSHDGNCWISHNAMACNQSRVSCNAWAMDNCVVKERAVLTDNAYISDIVVLQGDCTVKCTMRLSGRLIIGGKKILRGDYEFNSQIALSAYFQAEIEKRRAGQGATSTGIKRKLEDGN